MRRAGVLALLTLIALALAWPRVVEACASCGTDMEAAVFAARGLGVFPLAELGAEDLSLLRGLRWLGRADGVIDEIHAIRSRRGQHHALASQVVATARP